MERVMGIEPTYPAWKAGVLPMNYTRTCDFVSIANLRGFVNVFFHFLVFFLKNFLNRQFYLRFLQNGLSNKALAA